jgi:hypothetical protein
MTPERKEARLKNAASKVSQILAARGRAVSGNRMVNAINTLNTNQSALLHDAINEA